MCNKKERRKKEKNFFNNYLLNTMSSCDHPVASYQSSSAPT